MCSSAVALRAWIANRGVSVRAARVGAVAQGQITFARLVPDSVKAGSQFFIATHSPCVMGFFEATIHQFAEDGIEPIGFDDIPAVDLWKRFFADPPSYYRRLLADDYPTAPITR